MNTELQEQISSRRPSQAGRAKKRTTSQAYLVSAVVRHVRLLLIALWLGAAVFFSFVVAPGAFSVLPNRALSGALVNHTLGILNLGGFIIGLALLASFPLTTGETDVRALRAEAISLALVVLSTGVGHWVISARLEALRRAMGRPVDEVAQSDPMRVAFNSLHGYSVIVLLIGIIAALVALLLIARRTNKFEI